MKTVMDGLKHSRVHMTMLSETQWQDAMVAAGFTDVEMHRVAAKDGFVGTLVMIGTKASN